MSQRTKIAGWIAVGALAGALTTVSLPTWSEICDKSYDQCSRIWKQTVGKVVGIK